MTLFVVPKSIPATEARPRKPILAMTPHTKMATPIKDGRSAVIPPDAASLPCFWSALDFFFALGNIRRSGDAVETCLSRFVLLLRPVVVVGEAIVCSSLEDCSFVV